MSEEKEEVKVPKLGGIVASLRLRKVKKEESERKREEL